MARRAPCRHVTPRVPAARSATEGRSVERSADGDEVSRPEGAEARSVGAAARSSFSTRAVRQGALSPLSSRATLIVCEGWIGAAEAFLLDNGPGSQWWYSVAIPAVVYPQTNVRILRRCPARSAGHGFHLPCPGGGRPNCRRARAGPVSSAAHDGHRR